MWVVIGLTLSLVTGFSFFGFAADEDSLVVTDSSSDNDGDGMDDVWEVTNFGDLSHDCDTDANGDGVYDCVEFKIGRDPNALDSKGPGIYYDYDELGRIKRIERIPEK